MTLCRAVLALALLSPAPAILHAQAGDFGPVILRLPSGPRSLALGNTGVASRDDEVIFFNPAQLVNATGFSASGEWLSNSAGSGALSAVTRFGGGGIGLGMRFANYELPAGTYPATRANMTDAANTPGTSFEASVGYGTTIKGVRVGAVGKYAEELTSTVRLGRPLLDVGVSKDLFRMTMGLAVQNIGRDMDLSSRLIKMPVKTTFGVSHARPLGPYDVAVTGAVSVLRDEFVQPSGGVEIGYSWLSGYNVALRAGGRRAALGEQPFTAGLGLTADRISVDYALETSSGSRLGHRFGIRVR